ncbi:MAG TPA: hypothetical protein VIH24_00760 [Candidatus Limnocylindria bacterium]
MHLAKRWFWTLLLAAGVAGLAGYLTATLLPATYQAQARLLVGGVAPDINAVRVAESLALTYAELATTDPQLQRVIDRLALDMTTSELEESVSVVANGTTRIITVQATHTDPEVTADIANTVADEMILYSRRGLVRPESQLETIEPAETPTASTGTSPSLIAFLAGAAGLIAAGIIVASLEYFNHTVKTRQDLADLTGTPLLGAVNIGHGYAPTPIQPLVVEAGPETKTAFGYRTLGNRMPLGEPGDEDRVRTLLVVGSQSGEGSGEFAANLAAILSRAGRSITLIDADEVDKQVTRMFVPEGRVGLSELLALHEQEQTTAEAIDRVRIIRVPALSIIPVGMNEQAVVREERAERLLGIVRASSELVILSGASLDRSATALTWARLVDAVVIVARADVTRVEHLQSGVDSLGLVEATLVGAVLLERQRREKIRRPRESIQPATVNDLNAPVHPVAGSSTWSGRGAAAPSTPGSASERHTVGD